MNKIEKLINKYCSNGVEFAELSKLTDISTGQQLNKELLFDDGKYPVFNGGILQSGFYDKYNNDANTIIISQGGASAGYVNFIKTKFYAGAHCYVIKIKSNKLINKFCYYVLKNKQDKENINADIIFEIELIKQVEINIDYILMLIKKYYNENMKDKEIIVKIQKSIDATVELRSKKDLIMKFIETLTPNSDIDKDWMNFIKDKRIEELNIIIEEENLNKEETYKFVNNAFYNGYVQEYGTEISKILPSISIFSPSKDRTIKRLAVVEKLKAFFDKYKDICSKDIKLNG